MSRFSFLKVVPLLCAATAWLTAGDVAVSAQVVHHRDATHDVVATGEAGLRHAPKNRTADIVNVSSRRRRGALVEDVALRHLSRDNRGLYLDIKAGPGHPYQVSLATHGATFFYMSRDAKTIGCPNLAKRLDFSNSQIEITVPVNCIGYPKWTRTGFMAEYDEMESDGSIISYLDDGYSSHYGGPLRLGPKVFKN